jgi:hypothetical protein
MSVGCVIVEHMHMNFRYIISLMFVMSTVCVFGCEETENVVSIPEEIASAEVRGGDGAQPNDMQAPVEMDTSTDPVSPPGSTVKYTETREPCADQNPLRNAYFGDLHVHTGFSFDAWTYEVRVRPRDVYRFATGETVMLPPLDAKGEGTRPVSLSRPLDFVAVTDHAEYLAEIRGCTDPESEVYATTMCVEYRAGGQDSVYQFGLPLADTMPTRFEELCGDGAMDCPVVAAGVWSEIQDAAETYYDRSSTCGLTTFVAYEYSGTPLVRNAHRNVIFRNAEVPAMPTSYFDQPDVWKLWERLQAECIDAEGSCDVLAIPHNPNWSNGAMFYPEYPGAQTVEEERARAEFWARMEPVLEVFQHKGDAECKNGFEAFMGADEYCDFEKLRPVFDDCKDTLGFGATAGIGCVSWRDFYRYVLVDGLKEEGRIGANPFKLGVIAGTDTHAGLAGNTAEATYPGHLGDRDAAPVDRLARPAGTPGGVLENPGGLTGIWAVENSRDALFEALRRKEVFGTSGPRIIPRFFGGWSYEDSLCDAGGWLQKAYSDGVPMGGDLPAPPSGATAPVFVLQADGDPTEEGAPLARLQIIKGWVDSGGKKHTKVFDVVVADDIEAMSVDVTTCERTAVGFASACNVWSDPEFDPTVPAVYYARILEAPSCRWSTYLCNSLSPEEQPETCSDPEIKKVVHERAWTSPIWYTPN